MKKFLIAVVLCGIVSATWADRDTAPVIPRAIASSSGAYFLLVVPVSDKRVNWLWTAYSMGASGVFKELWSGGGRYSREIFLADDGRHVACVESWPEGHTPKNDIVIAVYDEGRLVKEYRSTDLVRDVSKLRHSSSHYRWLAEWPPVFAKQNTLFFTTIENDAYELDLTAGKIAPVTR